MSKQPPRQHLSTVLGEPREVLCYGNVYLEVHLVRQEGGGVGVRIRRYENTRDGRKFVRLGDLSVHEWGEVCEMVPDMLEGIGE